jgi:hypothetical protein
MALRCSASKLFGFLLLEKYPSSTPLFDNRRLEVDFRRPILKHFRGSLDQNYSFEIYYSRDCKIFAFDNTKLSSLTPPDVFASVLAPLLRTNFDCVYVTFKKK